MKVNQRERKEKVMDMKKTNHYTISYCICPNCNNRFPIPRKSAHARAKKHLKKIWCPFCKEENNMMEIRDQDFYKDASGGIMDNYRQEEEKEVFYINKMDLMNCSEMYEFDFR